MALKHDPTKGLRMPAADPNAAARRGEYAGVDMGHNPAAFIAEQQASDSECGRVNIACLWVACGVLSTVSPSPSLHLHALFIPSKP